MLTKRFIQKHIPGFATLYSAMVITFVMTLLASCGKDDSPIVTGTARITVTNAAPEAPSFDVYSGNEKLTSAAIPFGSTTGSLLNPYLPIEAGTVFMRISADGTNNLVQGNIPLEPDSSYSVFAYDSLNTSGKLRVLLLTDRLTPPASGRAHIRFLQLSPDTGRIYTRLVNNSDTVIIGYRPYVTASTPADLNLLAQYAPIDAGNYTLEVRLTDSTPIIYSTPFSLSDGKIVTIYSRGRKSNNGFSVAAIMHN